MMIGLPFVIAIPEKPICFALELDIQDARRRRVCGRVINNVLEHVAPLREVECCGIRVGGGEVGSDEAQTGAILGYVVQGIVVHRVADEPSRFAQRR